MQAPCGLSSTVCASPALIFLCSYISLAQRAAPNLCSSTTHTAAESPGNSSRGRVHGTRFPRLSHRIRSCRASHWAQILPILISRLASGAHRARTRFAAPTMLLPSAVSCDSVMAQPKPQRYSRPKLPSFESYDPRQRSQSPVVGLIASCRALQNMLGERFSSPSPALETTIRARHVGSPFGTRMPSPVCQPAPRGVNKRRRDQLEDEENIIPPHNKLRDEHNDLYSTPKRRRTVPFDLPQGLMASDFEALAETSSSQQETSRRRRRPRALEMPRMEEAHSPTLPVSQHTHNAWTETDDRLLVETVLSKLNLSSREWNDCPMQLGKDKDSLGRRWRLLLGEGNVCLRRGSGRMERVDLDTQSW